MKTTTSLFALLAVLFSGPVFGQAEPVVAVDDPESLFVDDDPVIHRNKQAALHIMRELLQCNQWDRAGEWITDRYIQHNPNAASGLEGVVTFFTEVMQRPRVDDCGKLTTPVAEVVAEDDIVVVMIAREYPDPRNPGQTYSTTWSDAWRFVDGKTGEHWDPATNTAPAGQEDANTRNSRRLLHGRPERDRGRILGPAPFLPALVPRRHRTLNRARSAAPTRQALRPRPRRRKRGAR